MENRFEGKKAFVTGGARGIGAAIAELLHREGARVAIGAKTERSANAFLEGHGAERFSAVGGDLSNRKQCHDAVNRAVTLLEGLDILVNSAGIFEDMPIEAVTQAHWDETIAVNLSGVFFCCQAALPALSRSRGNIVNIASDAALIGYGPAPVYGAAKGGVVSLSRTLAYSQVKRVRVNCVCPGNVATEMLLNSAAQTSDPESYLAQANARAPLGRMATPEEVAQAVAYFASDAAGFTTGVAMVIDGGGMSGYG